MSIVFFFADGFGVRRYRYAGVKCSRQSNLWTDSQRMLVFVLNISFKFSAYLRMIRSVMSVIY